MKGIGFTANGINIVLFLRLLHHETTEFGPFCGLN
jgi:hypothetical protein